MDDHIKALIKKAADSHHAVDALSYSQAAAHCASAVAIMAEQGKHL